MFKSNRSLKFLFLNFTISFLLLYLVFVNINANDALILIKDIKLEFLFLATLMSLFQVLVVANRWKLFFTSDNKIKFIFFIKHSYAFCFLTQVLPPYIGGDVYKFLITREILASTSKALSVILVEKYIALVALISLICLSSSLSAILYLEVWIDELNFYLFSFLILSVVMFSGLYMLGKVKPKSEYFLYFQKPVLSFLSMFKDINLCIKVYFVSLLGHMTLLLVFVFLGISLNIGLTFIQFSFVFFIVFLVTQIPVSIGGWGIRETSTISGMIIFGVDNEKAFALSTLFGLTLLLSYLPALITLVTSVKKLKI